MRPGELPDLVVKEMTSNWRILKAQMEPDLGPGTPVGGTDGEERRLIVHPGSIADLWHQKKHGTVDLQPWFNEQDWRMV